MKIIYWEYEAEGGEVRYIRATGVDNGQEVDLLTGELTIIFENSDRPDLSKLLEDALARSSTSWRGFTAEDLESWVITYAYDFFSRFEAVELDS